MTRKHPKNRLSAYIHRELDREATRLVRAHLERCGRCHAEYQRLRLGARLARQCRQGHVPVDLWEQIAARLPTVPSEPGPRSSRLWNLHLNIFPRYAYVIALFLLLVSIWWLVRSQLFEVSEIALSGYVSQIEQSAEVRAFSIASSVLTHFDQVDRIEASEAAGVAHVIGNDPLPGFELIEQRIRSIDQSKAVQLVYSDGHRLFAVFVAPEAIDFSFARRQISPVTVSDTACRRVESSKLETFWFGAGGFHCVLVSPLRTEEQNGAIIRYFTAAHDLLEKG